MTSRERHLTASVPSLAPGQWSGFAPPARCADPRLGPLGDRRLCGGFR